ncbi:uncharacterized protein E0L32_003199 [Thyridium curvatum]|uniref:CFEM domain-containing protein n=1 Tax=Thyridium curvatum TaxID=1093900 RepID=A0A507BJ57_9PEZI|nr:uncharacterized protein E0L32_003199 [Thyridium curvatum]TPX17081.1 hypothetical protein E0L32_003199 [Thyridium curvatum]
MKSALVLAVAGIAAAQNLSGQPACATSCLSSAITAAGCQATDQACACGSKQGQIGVLVAPCILSACSPADVAAAASVGSQLCVAFSATATASSTASGSGSGSASATGSMTTAGSSSSSKASTGGGGVGTVSTVTSTAGGGNGTITTGKPNPTNGGGSGGGSGGSGTTSKPSTPTNAAAQPVVWGAGAFVALIGAVAAL